MKLASIFMVLGLMSTPAFAASVVHVDFSEMNQTVLLDKVAAPELEIFLVYPGKLSNFCGIRISTPDGKLSGKELSGAVMVMTAGNRISVEQNRVVAWVEDENTSGFGQYFTIRSKTGDDINTILKDLYGEAGRLAVVGIVPCK